MTDNITTLITELQESAHETHEALRNSPSWTATTLRTALQLLISTHLAILGAYRRDRNELLELRKRCQEQSNQLHTIIEG